MASSTKSYVYIQSEPRLWTVGFYQTDGTWEPESDHSSIDSAAARVRYLNGGAETAPPGPNDPDFRGIVAWAENHVLDGIGKNAYQYAIWTVCERVAKWRYNQDHG